MDTDINLTDAKSGLITARNRLERADPDELVLLGLAHNEYIDAWLELTIVNIKRNEHEND